MKKRVLFVCIHNSARSQMAEAFLNECAPDAFIAHSAGLSPGNLNPNVVTVMVEIGIDISGNTTKDITQFLPKADQLDFVITVCDQASAEKCPHFPGNVTRLHWSFSDPSQFSGTEEEILKSVRTVRDEIKARITSFVQDSQATNGS